jgi:hypothetical protein
MKPKSLFLSIKERLNTNQMIAQTTQAETGIDFGPIEDRNNRFAFSKMRTMLDETAPELAQSKILISPESSSFPFVAALTIVKSLGQRIPTAQDGLFDYNHQSPSATSANVPSKIKRNRRQMKII